MTLKGGQEGRESNLDLLAAGCGALTVSKLVTLDLNLASATPLLKLGVIYIDQTKN